jgi:hypothetical protein
VPLEFSNPIAIRAGWYGRRADAPGRHLFADHFIIATGETPT